MNNIDIKQIYSARFNHNIQKIVYPLINGHEKQWTTLLSNAVLHAEYQNPTANNKSKKASIINTIHQYPQLTIPVVLKCLLLAMCVLSSQHSLSQSIVLQGDQEEYRLGRSLELLEDPSREISFEQIRSGQYDKDFVLSRSDVPNYGFSDSYYWVKFKITNQSSIETRWMLEMSEVKIDLFTLYIIDSDGKQREFTAGDFLPFNAREIDHHNFLFPIDIEKGDSIEVFAHFQSGYNLFPFKLYTPAEFIARTGNVRMIIGISLGFSLVMVIYHLFLYSSVRDIGYLYYVVYISSLSMLFLVLNGIAFQILWPSSPWWGNHCTPFFAAILMISATLFTMHFLNTTNFSPQMHRVLQTQSILGGIMVILGFILDVNLAVQLIIFLGLTVCISCMSAGFIAYSQHYRPASFYLLAFTLMIIGGIVYALRTLSILPSNLFTEYGIQLGSAIEIVLLSLGLADRINILEAEKQEAQIQALEQHEIAVKYHEEALQAAESANNLKDSFMSTITHEILTPINGIRLSLSLLKSEIPESSQEFLRTAESSNLHLLSLVNDMITFTEARRGKITVKNDVFDINKLLYGIYYQFDHENLLAFDFKYVGEKDETSFIIGDSQKISMIVMQLLKNASAFTKEGEIILKHELLPSDKDTEAILNLSVKDTGSGISENMKKEIFEGFSQGDNSITREHGGLGIGLTNIRDLLALMNGKLTLDSLEGVGSTFNIKISVGLPTLAQISSIERSKRDREKLKEIEDAGLITTKHKILVVEDNPVNMRLLVKVLEKAHYEPVTAENGKEAISTLQTNPDIAAVLMDCQMPVMDGYKATQKIRELAEFKMLPIIAVTANVSEADQQRCRDVGMSDYLAKPASRGLIEKVLSQWLS